MENSVADILAQMLDVNDDSEKIASVSTQETNVDGLEKFAADNGITVEEAAVIAQEVEAEDEHAEAEKQASEAMHMGRFMARGFFDELSKLGGVGGSEPTTVDQGASVPQDGSVANRVAEAISNMHGQKKTPSKEELKSVLRAQRANFVASTNGEVAPKTALTTEAK